MNDFSYDETGKIVLDDIYNQPTPVSYFAQLSELGYCIPERAKPHFERVIAARRAGRGAEAIKIVDVGCSYGVNAALIKYGQSMVELTDHYRDAVNQGLGRAALIAADQEFYAEPDDDATVIVGVDASQNAIDYAVAAGILDGGVAADLEVAAPNRAQSEVLGDTDLIISTGCYGYISETTFDRLLDVNDGKKPWMAHFVLRMFDYEGAAESLGARGYVTRRAGPPLRQRRFANEEERAHVLGNLAARGIDPEGREGDGWYYAELHLSCPAEEAEPLFGRWSNTEAVAG
jgi:hypothetical protein